MGMRKTPARLSGEGATPLAAMLREKVSGLRERAGEALRSFDADAVHDARVATRRLTAALDLLEPRLPAKPRKKFARGLRKLRRALGPLRDLDVMLQHLAQTPGGTTSAAGAAWVASRLRDEQAVMRQGLKKGKVSRAAAKLAAWDELEDAVRRAESSAAASLSRAVAEQLGAFAARAERLAGAAAGDRSNGDGAAEPAGMMHDDVHDLRVAGKRLRYTLELAAPLGLGLPKSVGRDFKALQEALGLWHDYAVLTARALALAADAELPARQPALFGQVLDLATANWRTSEHHLAEFRRLWAERGAALVERVAAYLPVELPG